MNLLYFQIFMILSLTSFSQQQDTCDYIAQHNTLGGLDCALGSTAPYIADSYQWLNCDSSYAPFPGDTTEGFTTDYAGYVALVVTAAGCTDTSHCQYHCVWGIEELDTSEAELIKVVDLTGKETENKPNTVLIYIYSDGTTKKAFRVE